jgi:hypothetical protein
MKWGLAQPVVEVSAATAADQDLSAYHLEELGFFSHLA